MEFGAAWVAHSGSRLAVTDIRRDCMYVAHSTLQKARKAHTCTWCGEGIAIGEIYKRWMSFGDRAFTNNMHIECADACIEYCIWSDDRAYKPFDNVRGEA